MQKLLVIFFVALSTSLFSQVNDGYNDPYNHWDGITHWTKYLTVSPGKFGPNALPVPRLENGLIDSVLTLQGSFLYHHNKGDKSPAVYGAIFIPAGKKVTFEISGVLAEYFNLSPELRFERRTFQLYGKGFTVGDIYLKNHIQLLKDHSKLPDLSFHVSFKTSTGGALQKARYTDAHGYQLYLSSGKSKTLADLNGNLRLYGLLGFFSWQTYDNLHRQDDAVMYGAGVGVTVNNLTLKHELTGYYGYRNLGDRPLVYRLEFLHASKKTFSIAYQYGINDFDYHSFAINYFFKKKK